MNDAYAAQIVTYLKEITVALNRISAELKKANAAPKAQK